MRPYTRQSTALLPWSTSTPSDADFDVPRARLENLHCRVRINTVRVHCCKSVRVEAVHPRVLNRVFVQATPPLLARIIDVSRRLVFIVGCCAFRNIAVYHVCLIPHACSAMSTTGVSDIHPVFWCTFGPLQVQLYLVQLSRGLVLHVWCLVSCRVLVS